MTGRPPIDHRMQRTGRVMYLDVCLEFWLRAWEVVPSIIVWFRWPRSRCDGVFVEF